MNGYPPQHADLPPSRDASADSTRLRSVHDHPEFRSMRRAYRTFGATVTTLVVGGFLLYVLLSSFAPGVLDRRLAGHLTLGLTLGLAQFAAMALAVWRHTVHMRRRIDPSARRLRAERERTEPGRFRAAPQEGRFRTW